MTWNVSLEPMQDVTKFNKTAGAPKSVFKKIPIDNSLFSETLGT